ncbi:MAG TPA: NYN domain-containing protein [Solirubrobacterales bacterium]|nr:NYN domain-containing protein [Solirubrobacterales bacterium]
MKYPKTRVRFYIDGFNLYYGALRGTTYRWLDIESLCRQYVKPGSELIAIKYFTAKVKDRPDNPGQQEDQREYLRALKTLPNVEIIYGRFLTRKATRLLTQPPKRRKKGDIGLREVWVHEEKGSDVNLASHLLLDGSRARYDLAVVISNDSDLKTPVEIVREIYDAGVGIINPHSRRSYALSPHKIPAKSFYQRLQPRRILKAQLPLDLRDAEGEIRCPDGWCEQQTTPQK